MFFLWYRYRFRKKMVSKRSIGIGFEKILVSEKVSVLVSKKIGIEKSIGIGIGKILVLKKYRYWYRKKIGIEKSIEFCEWISLPLFVGQSDLISCPEQLNR